MIIISALLSGCAHPIKINPELNKLPPSSSPTKINAHIAYYIPPELSSLEVTTPGGGGDNIRYYPYKDIEAGYAQILNNTFTNVHKLQTENAVTSTSNNIDYIIQPTIITNSSSTGFFTWPPTNFTVDLTSNIRRLLDNKMTNVRAVGIGYVANDTDRLLDHGIAGRKAMEDALLKTQNYLLNLDFFLEKK